MKFAYNKTWILFVAAEEQGKTYQTEKLIREARVKEDRLRILDPNNKFGAHKKAKITIPSILEHTPAYLDRWLFERRAEKNILIIADDIDVFLKTGYESKQLDEIGKTIKQQSIGGILHSHRARFFNARIYQIVDYVFVGFGLRGSDLTFLRENANLDLDLYRKVRPRTWVLIDQEEYKPQRIVGGV